MRLFSNMALYSSKFSLLVKMYMLAEFQPDSACMVYTCHIMLMTYFASLNFNDALTTAYHVKVMVGVALASGLGVLSCVRNGNNSDCSHYF